MANMGRGAMVEYCSCQDVPIKVPNFENFVNMHMSTVLAQKSLSILETLQLHNETFFHSADSVDSLNCIILLTRVTRNRPSRFRRLH